MQENTKSKRGGARVGAGRPRLNEPRFILSMSLDAKTSNQFRQLAEKLNLSQPKTLKYLLDKHENSKP